MVVDGDRDDKRDAGHHARGGDEVRAVAVDVGEEAEGEDADEGDDVDGDGHELEGVAVVAHLADEGGDEVLNGLRALDRGLDKM